MLRASSRVLRALVRASSRAGLQLSVGVWSVLLAHAWFGLYCLHMHVACTCMLLALHGHGARLRATRAIEGNKGRLRASDGK